MSNLKNILLSKSRTQKRLILLALDILMIPMVTWIGFSLHFSTPYIPKNIEWLVFPLAIIVAIPIFIKLGLYRAVLKYLRIQAVASIIIATFLSTIVWVGIINITQLTDVPASVALIVWLGALTFITSTRLLARQWLYSENLKSKYQKNVLIYGAGETGSQLASILKTNHSYSIVGFIDDDPTLKGWSINGLSVYSPFHMDKLVESKSINEIILAIPSTGRSKRKNIINMLEPLPVNVRSIPALSDFASGKITVSDIKDIDIDDLLGRDAIKPNETLLPLNIKNKIVMVTGAGGSIGSELCRQIIKHSPSKLILVEQSEYGLYSIEQELDSILIKNGLNIPINRVLGSISNPVLLQRLFKNKNIQTIYHAAAYKHVPLVEENPVAGLNNNVFGTKILAEHALEANVETFILISTDKAVRPTNVMGCSKRVAELVLQALSEKANSKTIFTMVRFGNVLGSSGSVVPKFRQQIKTGGPITVTHKEITRFFMSIPEAVQLVIQAGAMGKGGDVFVLDMGKQVKIADLAKKMVKLSGLNIKDDNNQHGDIEIMYTGLRPGEKLYEELLIGENASGTEHPRIMRANEKHIHWEDLSNELNALRLVMQTEKVDKIKNQLSKIVSGYTPWIDSVKTSEKTSNNVVSIPRSSD